MFHHVFLCIMGCLRVGTFSVRGFQDTLKRAAVFGFIKDVRLTVCLLQEVHLQDGRDVGNFGRKWGEEGHCQVLGV